MTEPAMRWRAPVAALGALVLVYALGTWAVWFTPHGGSVAFWWPAAGVAVALVALAPRSWWPALALAVVLASVAANLTAGRPPSVSVCFGLANAAEAAVAGLLLKGRGGRLVDLGELGDFVTLVRATLAGAVVIGVGAAATVAGIESGPFWMTFRNVLTSHAAAVLVIVPLAMTWRLRSAVARWPEYAVQAMVAAMLTLLVFAPVEPFPLGFAALPAFVWAALRLDPRTVSLELLAGSVVAVWCTAHSRGPFGAEVDGGVVPLTLAAPLVQGYVLASALVALPLTLALTQRSRVMTALAERERLFRRNFTESMTGMLLLAEHGEQLQVIEANDTARELLDDGDRPVTGRRLDRVLTEPTALRQALRGMLAGDLEGWRGQVGIRHRPGSRVDVALSQISSGDQTRFAAQLLDVTALHDALAATRSAERLTGATLDTANCMIMLAELDGTMIRVNRGTTTLTGFSPEELIGRPVWETITPLHRQQVTRQMFEAPAGEAIPGTGETDVHTREGEIRRVVWNNDLVRDADGTPRYAVLTGVDVTAERTTSGLMRHLLQAGISTAIIGIDHHGRITLFNSGAESLVRRTAEDVHGTPFVELLDPDELAERTRDSDRGGWDALTTLLETGRESVVRDWTWRTGSGSRRTVAMSLSGGDSRFGPQAGWLVVGRDVTEERHGQTMLMAALDKERMAADRLRALDSAKNEFVSTVSHELRTPVTSIVGYSEMLADGAPVPPDPEQLPLLDTIARNGQRLVTLCNDLLTLAGLDAGGAAWSRATVDLCELVRHAEESLRPMLRGRDLELCVELAPGAVRVVGDTVQLERVIANLLSNAVKFTRDGGRVTTSVRCVDGEARLVVADTGIGIPEDEQTRLFQRFFRASTAQDLAIQGTGLGLSIVAGIVAAHSGRIGVESTVGVGTAITVRLPIAGS